MPTLLFFISFLSFGADAPLTVIGKSCAKSHPRDAKGICFCVTSNLKNHLSVPQLRELSKVYRNRRARYAASKSDAKKTILDLDYEIHKNCAKDPAWKVPTEDMGRPDRLED